MEVKDRGLFHENLRKQSRVSQGLLKRWLITLIRATDCLKLLLN